MTFGLYGLTGFEVQYWNGSAWADVTGGNITGNNKVWRKVTFSPLTTTRVRVLTNASPDGYSRLTELEAWGNATIAPPPVFSDNFNSTSLDTTKWSVVDPNSSAVVSDNGQQLQITLQPNTAAYNGVYSNATYDLTGKSVQVEEAQPISQAGWCENFIEVRRCKFYDGCERRDPWQR